jgi:hypothetical protein
MKDHISKPFVPRQMNRVLRRYLHDPVPRCPGAPAQPVGWSCVWRREPPASNSAACCCSVLLTMQLTRPLPVETPRSGAHLGSNPNLTTGIFR